MKKIPNPKTIKEMNQVWGNLMQFAKDHDQIIEVSKAFNEMLDTLLGEDFFGTEGQCDPRGDHRN